MTNEERREKIKRLIAEGKVKINYDALIKRLKGPKVEIIKDENKMVVDDIQKKDAIKNVEDEKLKEEQAALEFLGVEKVDDNEKSSADKMKEVREKAKAELSKNIIVSDERTISGLYHIIREEPGAFVEILKNRITETKNNIINNKSKPLGTEELNKLSTTLKLIALASELDRFDTAETVINENVDVNKAHEDMVSVKKCLEDLAFECLKMGNEEQVKEFKTAITDGNILLTTVENIIDENGINKESMDQILKLAEDAPSEDVEKIKELVSEAVGSEEQTGEVKEAIDQLNDINTNPGVIEVIEDSFGGNAEDTNERTMGIGETVARVAVAGVALRCAAVAQETIGGHLGDAMSIAGTLVAIDAVHPIINNVVKSMEDNFSGLAPLVMAMGMGLNNNNT